MKNIYLELLQNTSKNKITLLKDVNYRIQIDKKGKFEYVYIPYFDFKKITEFIRSLNDYKIYTMIPILSMDGRDEDPQIILSKQILLSSYSDPKLIADFLNKQLEIAIKDFEIGSLDRFHYLIFKYKKVELNI